MRVLSARTALWALLIGGLPSAAQAVWVPSPSQDRTRGAGPMALGTFFYAVLFVLLVASVSGPLICIVKGVFKRERKAMDDLVFLAWIIGLTAATFGLIAICEKLTE